MRLTEPGLYVARDGRRAMSYQSMTGLAFTIAEEDSRCDFYAAGSSGTEGEWQRIDVAALKWPDLPPKPKLLQCYTATKARNEPVWREFKYDSRYDAWFDGELINARAFIVVPHRENDPEAVAMIEAARKEATNYV